MLGGVPTANDSESNPMARAHAYKAQTPGFVNAWTSVGSLGTLKAYIGNTSDPEGAGEQADESGTNNGIPSVKCFVAVGKCFEITDSVADVLVIKWTPLVRGGGAPIDYN